MTEEIKMGAMTGTEGPDLLTGTDANDALKGLGGDDTLVGGLGDDMLDGGAGSDTAAFNDIDVPVVVDLPAGTASRETGFSIDVVNQPLAPLNGRTPTELVAEAAAGNLYYNIHTNDFPGGEIRGQLLVETDVEADGVRTLTLVATLDGAQEPFDASDSEATGTGRVVIVVDGDSVTYSSELSVSGLATSDLLPVAGISAIHLHNAPAGQNGPVITDIVQDAGGDTEGQNPDATDGNVFEEVRETDTLISIENAEGSDDGDVLLGNGGANVLNGNDGDDVLLGRGGDDVLLGGDGDDVLRGNGGDDELNGGAGDDSVSGGGGDDTVEGGAGNDILRGGAGDDILSGGGGRDIIDGGEGIDTNSFANINEGAAEASIAGVTVVLNADGSGTASYSGGGGNGPLIEEAFTGIENITGSSNNDDIRALGAAPNAIDGGAGDDFIAGGGGVDVLTGGEGNDTNSFINIGAEVVADLGSGSASYQPNATTTVFESFSGFENLDGSANNDQLFGDGGANTLTGNEGNDLLVGRGGNDVLEGGAGNDILRGGGGADITDGGEGIDTADFQDIGASVIADLNTGAAIYSGPNGAVVDTLLNIENLTGSSNDDILIGDDGENLLAGGAGDDIINGGAGDDIIRGDAIGDGEAITVTVTNTLGEGGTFLTPVWFGFHDGENFDLWTDGEAASGGLERIAEDGSVEGIAAEFNRQVAGGGVDATLIGGNGVPGPIDPGETASFTLNVNADQVGQGFFTWATMVIPSNDAFLASPDDALQDFIFDADGNFVGPLVIERFGNDVLDAGTEVNTEEGAAFLNQTARDQGIAENGVVRQHEGFNGSEGLPDATPVNILGGTTAPGAIVDPVEGDFTRNGGEEQLLRIVVDLAEGGNDVLSGGAGDDIIDGGRGNDLLRGGSGDDTLLGGDGNDRLIGGGGDDSAEGGAGADRIVTGGGDDLADGGAGNDRIETGNGADIANGGAGNDRIEAGNGNDIVNGGAGNDRIEGGRGRDIIDGGAGNDRLEGGGGGDAFIFGDDFGDDVITDFNAFSRNEVVDLTGGDFGFDSFGDLSHAISQDGGNAVIDLGADGSITLLGVQIADLNEDNILI